MKIIKSRNQREGRYRSEANRKRNEPLKTPFMNRRTYGANARRITQQFFNNANRYDTLNNPAVKWWKKPGQIIAKEATYDPVLQRYVMAEPSVRPDLEAVPN